MRGRTCSALIFLLLLSAQSRAETACVDLAQLAHSTVGITRYFDEAERNAQSDVAGIHGTGWFQSPTNIVTVGHVATAMGLSTEDWKPLDIKDGADGKLISARIRRWIGGGTEKLVVLELQAAFPAARSVAIRTAPLVTGRSSRNARLPRSKPTLCEWSVRAICDRRQARRHSPPRNVRRR